jgi:hypothetical protein
MRNIAIAWQQLACPIKLIASICLRGSIRPSNMPTKLMQFVSE